MMEFQMMGTTSCSLDNYLQGFPLQSRKFNLIKLHRLQYNMASWRSSTGLQRLFYSNVAVVCINPARHVSWRTLSTPVSLEESSLAELEDSSVDEKAPKTTAEDLLEKPWSSDELKALITDSERAKLVKKLSEANQQNRFLKRELHKKEDGLINFKSELAVMELEIQALVALAEEIAKLGIPEGSRKINGRYIQSHLLSRLEAVDEKLKDQIKDVDAAQSKEVSLYWFGMAESVQVMGTFDGWSQGEHLSPEYNGSYSKFSTKLMLRPGRYEIKFLVDGEWQLLSEFPTVGEGLTKNNLLVVK